MAYYPKIFDSPVREAAESLTKSWSQIAPRLFLVAMRFMNALDSSLAEPSRVMTADNRRVPYSPASACTPLCIMHLFSAYVLRCSLFALLFVATVEPVMLSFWTTMPGEQKSGSVMDTRP